VENRNLDSNQHSGGDFESSCRFALEHRAVVQYILESIWKLAYRIFVAYTVQSETLPSLRVPQYVQPFGLIAGGTSESDKDTVLMPLVL
jgi:hypothetical protein